MLISDVSDQEEKDDWSFSGEHSNIHLQVWKYGPLHHLWERLHWIKSTSMPLALISEKEGLLENARSDDSSCYASKNRSASALDTRCWN